MKSGICCQSYLTWGASHCLKHHPQQEARTLVLSIFWVHFLFSDWQPAWTYQSSPCAINSAHTGEMKACINTQWLTDLRLTCRVNTSALIQTAGRLQHDFMMQGCTASESVCSGVSGALCSSSCLSRQKLYKHTEPRVNTQIHTHTCTHTLKTMAITRHTWVPACAILLISFKSPHKVCLP